MFISSYNTYIHTNSANTTSKQKVPESAVASKDFAGKLKSSAVSFNSNFLPLDYIQKNNNSYIKQQIDISLENSKKSAMESAKKFSNHVILLNAGSAYLSNTKMFSQFRLPHTPINQTPSLDDTLPKEPKEMKELIVRHKMVNTYIENDRYYQVTA